MASRPRSCSQLASSAGLQHRNPRNVSWRQLHSSARRHQGEFGESSRRTRRVGNQIDEAVAENRDKIHRWLNGPGSKFKLPLRGSTNYLNAYNISGELKRRSQASDGEVSKDDADPLEAEMHKQRSKEKANRGDGEDKLPPESLADLKPFPENWHFRSQPVLSEDFREEIWRRVIKQGDDVKVVSASLGVTIERVAAVVRLKEIEKRWGREGKPLATPYSEAVLAMLPTTPFDPTGKPVGHESINDLQVHPHTKSQLYHPTPESRPFTREDAGRAFDDDLMPAEKRIPHSQLVDMEKDILAGASQEERVARATARMREENEWRRTEAQRRREKQERETKVVRSRRWDFVFREANAEAAGRDGRGERGVGWRYGLPHEDRKKGQVKIPRRVL